MNRAHVSLRLSNLVGPRAAKPSDETIAYVAELIDRLDPRSPCYEPNVEMLLSLEATLWTLECGTGLRA
jgi:hypothetical protein